MVQLTDELVSLLDAEADRRGVSRSALIREVLDRYLKEGREAEVGRRIVEGYRRFPQAALDEWGNLGALADRSTAETLKRLDTEEREAGITW